MSVPSAEVPSVERAISETEKFLAPALRERDSNQSLIAKLVLAKEATFTLESRPEILQEAGRLLESLNEAVAFDQKSDGPKQAYDSRLLGAVYNLLDVLVLEGIYPALPPGVGDAVERRTKSLLYRKPDPSYVSPPNDEGLIEIATKVLNGILANPDSGIEPIIRYRILGDLITANAWLSYSQGSSLFSVKFNQYLNRLSIPTLYLDLTSLNRPTAPAWFRSIIAGYLSQLPLRPNGVRHTIEFIASSMPLPQAPKGQDDAKPSKGPSLPLEGLQQASKLLSSVPSSMTADIYFTRLAPQLLDLLDQTEERDLSRAVAFIIGSGILGKRSVGAPGTIGWKLFAEPNIRALSPTVNTTPRKRKADSDGTTLNKELVSQTTLATALKRLNMLTSSHPNPGLTSRLIKPILLSLWALMNYQSPTISTSQWSESAFNILQTFYKISGGLNHVEILSGNLLFDGGPEWVFGLGSEGGIAIRERDLQQSVNLNIIELVPRIDSRVHQLLRLLSTGSVDERVISSLFLSLTREWLLPKSEAQNQLQVEADPLQTLAKAKLAQAILEKFQDKISKQPDQILALIEQILQQYSETIRNEIRREDALNTPTYSSLTNLVNTKEKPDSFVIADDPQETLAVAVSLLNAILTSSTFTPEAAVAPLLFKIQVLLSSFSKMPDHNLPASLTLSIQSSLSLLSIATDPANSSISNSHEDEMSEYQTLNLILTDLSSTLPPIRTSALHALSALIKIPTEPIDVPTITLLLLNTIRSDNEEYVYLAAIRVLVMLAVKRDVRFVVRATGEAFQDVREESGVDGRLRTGEALSELIKEIAEAEEVAKRGSGLEATRNSTMSGVAELCITVAGRRGERKREGEERKQKERFEKRKKREAERAWGGEIPTLPSDDDDNDEGEFPTPQQKQRQLKEREAISTIISGWENTGLEEDFRIRTSSLSILSTIFANHQTLTTLPASILTNTIQLALSILTLETSPTAAILRRASVLLLLSLLKSSDAALEEGIETTVGVETWSDVEKVLSFTLDTDTDDLVRDHAESFLESLEAWRMKRVQFASRGGLRSGDEEGVERIRFGLEGRLRGLAVNPVLDGEGEGGSGKRVGIIEEIE